MNNPPPTLQSLTRSILQDILITTIHALVLKHHSHEALLLRSALEPPIIPNDFPDQYPSLSPSTNNVTNINTALKLPICSSCHLPRLLDPPLSISQVDKSVIYCTHTPWSRRSGHDIYGNPFPVAGSDKPPTKKEREAQAKAKADAAARGQTETTANDDNDDNPQTSGGTAVVDKKSAKVDQRLKGGTYVPWHTCPSCKRSLLITRFAQHLEKCLGIGGRGVRAAAANANAANGKLSGSTSRAGTPGGGSSKDGEGSDEEADDVTPVGKKDSGDVRKQVLKKGLGVKLKKDKDGKISIGATNGKLNKIKLISGADNGKSNGKTTDDGTNSPREKREREDDEDDGDDSMSSHQRKKQKIQRQLSTVSIGTAGSPNPDYEPSLMGEDSVDGSFLQVEEGEISDDE